MADVFISYAHTTAKHALGAAAALRAAGYSVWLDEDLATHRAFTHVIEEQLTAAKAALVIWSRDAAKSEWVLSEANRAREDHKLVQLVIDKTRLPMPFDQILCADISGWTGEGEHPNWRKVIASVDEIVGNVRAPAIAATSRPAPEPLLAVLAFDNLSGDPEMAYFSDGVSEEILQTVGRSAELKVIGRSSSFQLRGADKAAAHVAAELKATHMLDGSVRRSGRRVRVAAQLIACDSGVGLWSERFDHDLSDVFALQDEIAAAVAAALKVAFAPAKRLGPIDPTAYDLYLRTRASTAPTDAIELLEAAVALAPDFAGAWAELAMWRVRARRYSSPATVKLSDAAAAAQKALTLDPSLGVVYVALSQLEPLGNYQAREALLLKALADAPTDPTALASMSVFCSDTGRIRASLDYASRSRDLNPKDHASALWYALALDAMGRYAETRPLWQAYLARWPGARRVITMNALAAAGDGADWTWFETLVRETPESLLAASPELSALPPFYRSVRDPDPQYLAGLLDLARRALTQSGSVPLNILRAACSLGANDEAFQLIDKSSYAFMFDPEGSLPAEGGMRGVLFRQSNRPMINDPRFLTLCVKLGLCDYWIASGCWPDCADDTPYDFRAEVAAAKRRRA
jgi:TolB-like protein